MNKELIPSLVNKPAIRAYLGGSFDPVHLGHMQMAMAVYNTLAPMAAQQNRELQVSLLPNARSPFKTKSTDPNDRLAMLNLAVQGTPVNINELEIWQTPPVYTIDSVRALRNHHPYDTLIFIMGMDSARSLAQWKDGLQLTDYVDLWIFNRNDHLIQQSPNNAVLAHELPVKLQAQVIKSYFELLFLPVPSDHKLLAHSISKDSPLQDSPLKDTNQGRIYIDTQAVMSVSSTEIRQQLYEQNHTKNKVLLLPVQGATTRPNPLPQLLDSKVYHYIIAHQLYSAD